MREPEIKMAVLKWLLNRCRKDQVIGAELHFSNGLNRADLVLSSPSELVAFEIKSSFDDFRRFERQQSAYKQAFLESFLVVPTELLAVAQAKTDRSTGILLIDSTGTVTQRRQSARRTRLAKTQALAWLRDFEKRDLMSSSSSTKKLDAFSDRDLTQAALESVYNRIRPRFNNFLAERGAVINSDDLMMLSLPSRIR